MRPSTARGDALTAGRTTGVRTTGAAAAGLPRPRTGLGADVLVASVVAGVLSGAPSTAHALLTGRSPLAAARAAGTLLGQEGLGRGLVAHAGITVLWTAVLARLLPRGHEVAGGAAAGLAIAALDLCVIGRRYPAIAALPAGPQVADHLAFGIAVGATLRTRRARLAR